MTDACANGKFTLPNIVIRGGSELPPTSKMELFLTIISNWKPLTMVTKNSILEDSRSLDPAIVNIADSGRQRRVIELIYNIYHVSRAIWQRN